MLILFNGCLFLCDAAIFIAAGSQAINSHRSLALHTVNDTLTSANCFSGLEDGEYFL